MHLVTKYVNLIVQIFQLRQQTRKNLIILNYFLLLHKNEYILRHIEAKSQFTPNGIKSFIAMAACMMSVNKVQNKRRREEGDERERGEEGEREGEGKEEENIAKGTTDPGVDYFKQ